MAVLKDSEPCSAEGRAENGSRVCGKAGDLGGWKRGLWSVEGRWVRTRTRAGGQNGQPKRAVGPKPA